VPAARVDKATGEKKPLLETVIEKKSIINLVNRLLYLRSGHGADPRCKRCKLSQWQSRLAFDYIFS
jgi:hypothetical protein